MHIDTDADDNGKPIVIPCPNEATRFWPPAMKTRKGRLIFQLALCNQHFEEKESSNG